MLAIDDMRDPAEYEAYLRPILDRLKAIDGRAPVSIMTSQVDPNDPRLQGWLKEGLSLEVHTLTHPCPLLAEGRLRRGGADLPRLRRPDEPDPRQQAGRLPDAVLRLAQHASAPGSSPRSSTRRAPAGTSCRSTPRSSPSSRPTIPRLPRELVLDPDGSERFRKYIPFPSFVNTIENYPYPYVIGGLCWEFPCIVPSDWEAQNLHKPNNPKTARRHEGRARLRRRSSRASSTSSSTPRLDQERAGRRADRPRGQEARQEGQVPQLPRGPGAAEQEPARRAVRSANAEGTDPPSTSTAMSSIAVAARPTGRRPACRAARAASTTKGRDAGLRFVDLDEDGHVDVVFSNDEDYGIYLFDPTAKGWTRKVMAGKAGEPGRLAEDRPRRHEQRLLRPLAAASGGRTRTPPSCPNLVDRRSFNDLLKDVEPRGKSPEASLRIDPGRARVHGRAGRGRAAGEGPDRLRLGGRRPALGRRDGRLPARRRRQGEAGRASSASWKTPTATAGTTRRPTFLDGLGFPTGLMPWRNGVLVACAPTSSTPRTATATARPTIARSCSPASPRATSSTGSTASSWASTAGSTAPTATAAGTVRSLKTGKTVDIQRPRLPVPARRRRVRGRERPDPVRPAPRRLGPLVRQQQPQLGLALRPGRRDLRRNPQFAAARPAADARARHAALSRSAGRSPGSTTRRGQPRDLGQQPDALSRRPLRPRVRHQPVRQRAGAQPRPPDGARARRRRPSAAIARPDEADREFLASSDNWFRPTMLKTGPDGALWVADMYRAVIEHPEWIPDDWEKRLDLRAGSDQGRIYRVYPGRQEAPADPPARPARHRRPRRRARQPERLAARHGPAAAAAPGRPAAVGAAPRAGRARRRGPRRGCRRSGRSQTSAALTRRAGRSPALADPHPQVRRNARRRRSRPLLATARPGAGRGGPAAGRRPRPAGPVPARADAWATGTTPRRPRPWRGWPAATGPTPGSARPS